MLAQNLGSLFMCERGHSKNVRVLIETDYEGSCFNKKRESIDIHSKNVRVLIETDYEGSCFNKNREAKLKKLRRD